LIRRVGQFLLITLIRGGLFLVPVVLVAILAQEGYQMLRRIAEPVARLMPQDRVLGLVVEDLLSVVAIVVVFLAAGLFVGTAPGRLLGSRLEHGILYRVPGYFLLRGVVGSVPGLDRERLTAPALVETDDGWAFALVVEEGPPGFRTVYLPDAPTPTSGAVRIVAASRVRPLDAPMLGLLGCLARSGAGAAELAGATLAKAPAPDGG
jgi:uncharacterized membrane protein